MRRINAREEYLNWLMDIVSGDEYHSKYYENLFKILYEKEFVWYDDMDENRACDGIELRDRFADENNIHIECLTGPCSVLEMMIGLADRMERTFMVNDSFGDRTPRWFWSMIRSLGLLDQDDGRYDEYEIDDILENFMSKNIESNGKGGLFTIHSGRKDMRKLNIWYQMQCYINEIEE